MGARCCTLAAAPAPGRGIFAPEQMSATEPSSAELAVAEQALDAAPFDRASLLYARVDLVAGADDPLLLELELAEPSCSSRAPRGRDRLRAQHRRGRSGHRIEREVSDEYRTLGQRLRGVGAVPRHDDVWRRDRRSGSANSWTSSSTPAERSSTPPTSTPPAPRRRSSGGGLQRDRVTWSTASSSPPRAGLRWATTRTLGTSRRHLRRALDDSLARLGVDHVDLYQLHAWDPRTHRRDAALPRRRRTRRDRLSGPVELHRVAGPKGGRRGRAGPPRGPGDAPTVVQPAGAEHRVRDRARMRAQRDRAAAVEPARWWLALGQVHPRPASDGSDPVAGRTRARHRAYDRVGGQERTWDILLRSRTRPRRVARPCRRSRRPGSWAGRWSAR